MGEVDTVRNSFVQLWGSMGPFWGISPTTARVYSWLLSRSEPADTEEIMSGLGGLDRPCSRRRETVRG
ncbi:MAG: hypothetical protein AAGN46_14250, partial [Acidobacteriota bacterium]